METNNFNPDEDIDDAANQEDYPENGNLGQSQTWNDNNPGPDLSDDEGDDLFDDEEEDLGDTEDAGKDGSANDADGNGGYPDDAGVIGNKP